MRCGIFSNAKGNITIVHDKPIEQDAVQWLEYDTTDRSFSLIYQDGEIQKLGIKLDEKMHTNLFKAKNVLIAYIANKKIISKQTLTIIVKQY